MSEEFKLNRMMMFVIIVFMIAALVGIYFRLPHSRVHSDTSSSSDVPRLNVVKK